MTKTLRRVLVRPPLPEDAARWRDYGWRAAPDRRRRRGSEHEALCGILESAGAEVVVSRHDPGNPDAIYAYDPVLVGEARAPSSSPGQRSSSIASPRRSPPTSRRQACRSWQRFVAPAFVEGGDTLWLDERTLLVGIGYRTNAESIAAARGGLPGSRAPDLRPPALERHRGGAAPHVPHLAARRRSRRGLSAAGPGAPPPPPRRPRNRRRRGAGRGVRISGLERPRTRPAPCSCARRQSRDQATHGARRGRRHRVSR